MQRNGSEKIGNVTLDLTYYPGQDFYSDGEIEDQILDIVKNNDPSSFRRIIEERRDWPTLYHLSSIRGNIVDWIPFTGKEKVLEIGAGPGAITGVLADKCASVTCVELSHKRSLINAYRHRDHDNITIRVGNFEDIEPHLDHDYDYIFLIGVFEYASHYIHSNDPFHEELLRILPHLSKEGRLVMAIENRLGLKYFAGCREDHSGRFFDGIESYQNPGAPATTFSRPALEKIFTECGIGEYHFYYPYPDYKFPSCIYSDLMLPSGSELGDNIRNFDSDRLLLFNESKAYAGITRDGLYPIFANSFEVVIGKELPVAYCKYSNDRDPAYEIKTVIGTMDGQPCVVKYPITPEAKSHVAGLIDARALLKSRYEAQASAAPDGTFTLAPMLHVADCRPLEAQGVTPPGVCFEYIFGRSLESLLDERLNAGDRDGFLALLHSYQERIGGGEDIQISDYDMTFANIIIDKDSWTAVDYEWAVPVKTPIDELLYRSMLCYFRGDGRRRALLEEMLTEEELLGLIGVSKEKAKSLSREENAFQKKVTGGRIPLGELRAQMGAAVIKPRELQSREEIEEAKKQRQEENQGKITSLADVQIYEDTGNGFNEQQMEILSAPYRGEGMLEVTRTLGPEVRALRLDPALCPCVVILKEVTAGGSTSRALTGNYSHNGHKGPGGSIVFTNSDPNMVWDLKKVRRKAHVKAEEALTLKITLQMSGLPGSMAASLDDQANKHHGIMNWFK